MGMFSEQEAKELGIKKVLLDEWGEVMQAFWTASIAFYKLSNQNEEVFPVNKDNEILLGKHLKINASLINNKYVECYLYNDDVELAMIRYQGNVNIICQCFFMIIKAYGHDDG